MAFTDWTLNSTGTAASSRLHSLYANPLTGRGLSARSVAGGNHGGRCLQAATRNVAATVSTEVSAWLRVDRTSGVNVASSVFLAGTDVSPTGGSNGALPSRGYSAGLFAYSAAGTAATIRMHASNTGLTTTVSSISVQGGTWIRVRLRRIYVDATNLRITVDTADLATPDTWVNRIDVTYTGPDTGGTTPFLGGVQPTMGWTVQSSASGGLCSIDGLLCGVMA